MAVVGSSRALPRTLPALLGVLLAAAALGLATARLRHRGGALPAGPDGAVRVALLSDTHLVGPQYALGTESNALDNESVLKTQQRLWEVVGRVRRAAPRPHLALFLGDVVHNG